MPVKIFHESCWPNPLRPDLKHNYVSLEQKTLAKIEAAQKRIKEQLVHYDDLKRMKLHFLRSLQEAL